mmetsp:Transcript_91601/g.259321  ORF Transcript_91601/g.259321 Transcript_91601/m.259321 type:complete len:230 (-) Transcript_91601:716-1405(-)
MRSTSLSMWAMRSSTSVQSWSRSLDSNFSVRHILHCTARTSLARACPRAFKTPAVNSPASKAPESSKSRMSNKFSACRTSMSNSFRYANTSGRFRACRNSSLVIWPSPFTSVARKTSAVFTATFRASASWCFIVSAFWFMACSSVLSTITATMTFMMEKVVPTRNRKKMTQIQGSCRMALRATVGHPSRVIIWKSVNMLFTTVPKCSSTFGSLAPYTFPSVRVRKIANM